MAVGKTSSAPSVPTTCTCAHAGYEHALIRCGCTNKRTHTHGDPLQHADDAFHRVWCCTCMCYCSKDPRCPAPLPGKDTGAIQKRLPLLLSLPYQLITLPFSIFASIGAWFRNSFTRRRRQPAPVTVTHNEKAAQTFN